MLRIKIFLNGKITKSYRDFLKRVEFFSLRTITLGVRNVSRVQQNHTTKTSTQENAIKAEIDISVSLSTLFHGRERYNNQPVNHSSELGNENLPCC